MANEIYFRLGFFFSIFLIMSLWELAQPRRHLHYSKKQRWSQHLGLTFFNSIAARLILPMGLSGLAIYVEQQNLGLFNAAAFSATPKPIVILLCLVLLDMTIYWQHRLFHVIPWLWRLHRLHHSDLDYDTTTALRFHPLEIILSIGIKASVIVLLGVPAVAVVAFEILLNGLAMFNHGNIKLPEKVDKLLRYFIVTPDMHRVHHSDIISESSTNYGFNLSLWDRAFGSYLHSAKATQEDMVFGIKNCPQAAQQHLHQLLLQPLANLTAKDKEKSST